jgi:hypothetical protein
MNVIQIAAGILLAAWVVGFCWALELSSQERRQRRAQFAQEKREQERRERNWAQLRATRNARIAERGLPPEPPPGDQAWSDWWAKVAVAGYDVETLAPLPPRDC